MTPTPRRLSERRKYAHIGKRRKTLAEAFEPIVDMAIEGDPDAILCVRLMQDVCLKLLGRTTQGDPRC